MPHVVLTRLSRDHCLSGQRVAVVHPLALEHHRAVAVVLRAVAPAHALAQLALVLNHADVRVVLATVAHVPLVRAEALVRHIVVLVVQHAPAERHLAQHIALPAFAILVEIHHLVVFHLAQVPVVHAQQLLLLQVRHDSALAVHLHQQRLVHLDHSFVDRERRHRIEVVHAERERGEEFGAGSGKREGGHSASQRLQNGQCVFPSDDFHGIANEWVLWVIR